MNATARRIHQADVQSAKDAVDLAHIFGASVQLRRHTFVLRLAKLTRPSFNQFDILRRLATRALAAAGRP